MNRNAIHHLNEFSKLVDDGVAKTTALQQFNELMRWPQADLEGLIILHCKANGFSEDAIKHLSMAMYEGTQYLFKQRELAMTLEANEDDIEF